MHTIFIFFKKTLFRVKRAPFIRLSFVSLVLFLCAGAGIKAVEMDISLTEAFWWSLVTVTTVGYGDIVPQTSVGKIIGGALMLFGIGFIGLFTGTLAATFIEGKSKMEKGLKSVKVKGHICLCGWNYKALEIIEELRADLKTKLKPIVLVANMPESPFNDENFFFVRGDVTPEVLKKAGIERAECAIVIGDEGIESYSRDAKAILNVLTLKTVNPDLYICIEIADRANYDHCLRAKADEVVVSGELCSSLLVQAAVDHGMTRVVSELVSNRYGAEFYKIKAPDVIIGQSFLKALTILKQQDNVTLIAIESRDGKDFEINPGSDYIIKEGARVIVIGEERPEER